MSIINRRKVHHTYTKLRPLKAWPFLAASLLFLLIGIYGLRQNNYEMIRLRDEVIEADKNNGDVEGALAELRSFVYGHMNTDLNSGKLAINEPPLQLKYRYDRLAAQQEATVSKQNEQIKKKAASICAQRYPGAGFNSPRVNCVADYVRQNGVQVGDVPSDLYKFNFISPRWSPDLAGLSLLASAIFFTLFIIKLLVNWWYKKLI